MRFFLAWVEAGQAFDPKLHAREDLQIFDLKIQETEGSFAHADLRLRVCDLAQIAAQKGLEALVSVGYEEQISFLFRGRSMGCPREIADELMTLRLVAEPANLTAELAALYPQLAQHPYIDPLCQWPASDEQVDVASLLEARAAAIYWCRRTHKPTVSPLTNASHTVDLTSTGDSERFSIKLVHRPYDKVDVELTASWCQQVRGATRLDHVLQAHLPDGLLSTFTGRDLERKWWKAGQSLKRSGYEILQSSLEKISVGRTGALNLYPQASLPIWVAPTDPLAPKSRRQQSRARQVRLKRSYYRPRLKVGWHYTQKREEVVRLSLPNAHQLATSDARHIKKINLRLKHILSEEQSVPWVAHRWYPKGDKVSHRGLVYRSLRSHESGVNFEAESHHWQNMGPETRDSLQEMRGSFFTTDRGHQLVAHAIARAQAHLVASTRAVEIDLVCPLREAIGLTCDHMVHLRDPRLPGGTAIGKVVYLSFQVSGEPGVAEAHVKLACSIGAGSDSTIPQGRSAMVYGTDLFEEGLMETATCYFGIDNIAYPNLLDKLPADRFAQPRRMSASDLLRRVDIVYDARAQQTLLAEGQYPKTTNLEALLNSMKTRVVLQFEDLRSQDVLRHQIDVPTLTPWSGANQLDLRSYGGNDDTTV